MSESEAPLMVYRRRESDRIRYQGAGLGSFTRCWGFMEGT